MSTSEQTTFKPPQEPLAAERSGTEYVVLANVEGYGWQSQATVVASNADFAIRLVAEDPEAATSLGPDPVGWVAVPKRSWQPRTVRVQVQRKVTIE